MKALRLKDAIVDRLAGRINHDEFLDLLLRIGPSVQEVIYQIEESISNKNALLLWDFVMYVHKTKSRDYTAVLCKILDQFDEEYPNEDVVETLDELRDPKAFEVLCKGVGVALPHDEYFQLNTKCLLALAHLGTEDALKVIQDALANENENIRLAAEDAMVVFRSRDGLSL